MDINIISLKKMCIDVSGFHSRNSFFWHVIGHENFNVTHTSAILFPTRWYYFLFYVLWPYHAVSSVSCLQELVAIRPLSVCLGVSCCLCFIIDNLTHFMILWLKQLIVSRLTSVFILKLAGPVKNSHII